MTELVLNTTGDLIEYPELPEYPSCDEIMSLARHLNAHFTEINGEYHASDSDDHSVMPESGCMPEPTPVIDNNGAVENSDGPVEPPAQPA